jgi:uridine phosphorylase
LSRIAESPIFSPVDFHTYLAKRNKQPPDKLNVPAKLIVTFHRNIFEPTRKRIRGHFVPWYYSKRLAVGSVKGVPLGVLYSFIGSSAASMMLEEMIASGARQVIEVGLCGGLVPSLSAGEMILVDEAFADEGTSRHYYEGARRFPTTPELTRRVERLLSGKKIRYRVGAVWTTDAPYRETRTKLMRFRKMGALGVNMESSALFAVGSYRTIDLASLQVVSDLVIERNWKPMFHATEVMKQSLVAANIAVDTFTDYQVES